MLTSRSHDTIHPPHFRDEQELLRPMGVAGINGVNGGGGGGGLVGINGG